MKLFDVTCPKCGGSISVQEGVKFGDKLKCSYCDCNFIFDDGVKRVEHKVVGGREAGYDFEMGRMQAQRDAELRKEEYEANLEAAMAQQDEVQKQWERERQAKYDEAEKHRKRGRIILWILFFPIMLLTTVLKSGKISFEAKLFIVVIAIGGIIYICTGGRLWS